MMKVKKEIVHKPFKNNKPQISKIAQSHRSMPTSKLNSFISASPTLERKAFEISRRVPQV